MTKTPDELRREYLRMLHEEDVRDRRRLALRLTGWGVLLASLLVVGWVAVRS